MWRLPHYHHSLTGVVTRSSMTPASSCFSTCCSGLASRSTSWGVTPAASNACLQGGGRAAPRHTCPGGGGSSRTTQLPHNVCVRGVWHCNKGATAHAEIACRCQHALQHSTRTTHADVCNCFAASFARRECKRHTSCGHGGLGGRAVKPAA